MFVYNIHIPPLLFHFPIYLQWREDETLRYSFTKVLLGDGQILDKKNKLFLELAQKERQE